MSQVPPTESAAAVSVSAVSYVYPGTRALDDVSFAIERGSVTALVGPNGAGKTTLLRCLAGLDQPLTGAISAAGVDVLEEPRLARSRMGYLSNFFLACTRTDRKVYPRLAARRRSNWPFSRSPVPI